MEPIEFKEQNVVFAKDQPQYQPLPAFRNESEQGEVISCWKLSGEEVELVGRTKKVWASMMTFNKALTPMFLSIRKNEVLNALDDIELSEPFRIYHTVKIKFDFWDCVKLMLGKSAEYSGFTDVDREVSVMASGGKTNVPDLIKKKSMGMSDFGGLTAPNQNKP